YEMLAETASVNVRGDRAAFPPRGFYGGGDAVKSDFSIQRSGGRSERIPSKFGGRIERGERLTIMTPGGGGFGDPGRRSVESLVEDYVNGKLSAEKIAADYGVDVRKAAKNQ